MYQWSEYSTGTGLSSNPIALICCFVDGGLNPCAYGIVGILMDLDFADFGMLK